MKTLRVLFVCEPGKNGAFRVLRSIIRQIFSKHPDIQVHFAYSSIRSSLELFDLIHEIESKGGITTDLKVGHGPCVGDFRAFLKLLLLARKTHADKVFSISSKAGALARIAAALPIPFPTVIHMPQAYFGMARKGGPRERFYNLLESILGHVCQTINCSEDERDFALKTLRIPKDRLLLVDNGIDTTRFIPGNPESNAAARSSLGLPAKGKILITIGRDSIQKNYSPLYAVLNEILPRADWTFCHAGEGAKALRSRLCSAAADHCHAIEHLNDIVPLLHAADGFVLTSLYEGLSLAMLEALSCGIPCIFPDTMGFHCLKKYGFGEIVWLSSPYSLESFRKSLKRALATWATEPPGHLREQRDIIMRHFSLEVQIEKVIAHYHS